jgi:hypothetical protein
MDRLRHNLSPVELKLFLKIIGYLTDNLYVYYCFKIAATCPNCGHDEMCRGGAVSLYSSSFDKITHEILVCLKCHYKDLSTQLTTERL